MEKSTMTVTEFARLEGISRPTAYNWIKQDGFPIIRMGEKGRIRIPVDAYRDWINAQAQAGGRKNANR